MGHAMHWPDAEMATHWLIDRHGMAAETAKSLLRAAGGRPEDALQFARSGRDPKAWSLLPKALQRGDGSSMQGWKPAEMVDALHKLCHDLQLCQQGMAPRFFAPEDLPAPAELRVLSQWGRELVAAQASAEHPFHVGLMHEALVSQAANALNSQP